MNAVVSITNKSLTTRFSERFGVDEGKVFGILKATAFKTKEGAPSDEQMTALLIVADQYGLNPFTKEIYAFPDKQNGIVPVVGVDGWSRIINSHPQFDGMDFVQSDISIKPDADAKDCPQWIECRIYRKDRSHPIAVREFVDETYRKAFEGKGSSGAYKVAGPWQSHTKRMLRHKAMIQCARLAFGFVGIYDEDEAERIIEGEFNVRAERASPGVQAVQRTIPEDTPERLQLITKLLAVADNGVEAFRSAWAELPKDRRALITDKIDDFKVRAEKADQAKVAQA